MNEVNTAYPEQGYYTTGYPCADAYLRKPPRYGLPEALGFYLTGPPRTAGGWIALIGVVGALGYAAVKLGKYAITS